MHLIFIDWLIIIVLMLIYIVVGVWVTKRSGKSSSEYFLSGRNMPWLLLGVSMVATTFSIDTPNLVTNIVRVHGISGNWMWWAFLLTGMLTVFIYAKLWPGKSFYR
jgi:SSS family solute:Na+ symporter